MFRIGKLVKWGVASTLAGALFVGQAYATVITSIDVFATGTGASQNVFSGSHDLASQGTLTLVDSPLLSFMGRNFNNIDSFDLAITTSSADTAYNVDWSVDGTGLASFIGLPPVARFNFPGSQSYSSGGGDSMGSIAAVAIPGIDQNVTANILSAIASVTVTAVPIPPSIWLLGSALLGLVGLRRFGSNDESLSA